MSITPAGAAPQTAVVTGAGGGIGQAIIERFLSSGMYVVAIDLPGVTPVAADRLDWLEADITREKSIRGAMTAAFETAGRLDIIVNNAGIGGAYGPLAQLRAADWDATFAVLVRAPALATKYAAQSMNTGGAIVNIASIAGRSGGCAPPAYSAAKAALISLTQTSAVELASNQIRVNAICPGVVMTPLVHRGRPERARAIIGSIQPLAGPIMPADVADAVAFLISPSARAITGTELVVDGGISAAGPAYAAKLFGAPTTAGIDRPEA